MDGEVLRSPKYGQLRKKGNNGAENVLNLPFFSKTLSDDPAREKIGPLSPKQKEKFQRLKDENKRLRKTEIPMDQPARDLIENLSKALKNQRLRPESSTMQLP